MNLKHMLFSGATALLLSIGFSACNENPGDNTGGTPSAVTGLYATSVNSTTVNLKWTASSDTGTITYQIKRTATTATDTLTEVSTTNSYTASNLQAGEYTFTVSAVRNGKASPEASVKWAGANRTSASINMYEFASSNGSAIQIYDPTTGMLSAKNVSMAGSKTAYPECQIAVYMDDATNELIIGPAVAFVGTYTNAAKCDNSVYISDTAYFANSLNESYPTKSIDQYVNTTKNDFAYHLPMGTITNNVVFFFRTGTVGNYHYGRIFINKVGSSLLQGTGTNRYVSAEISYQNQPNLPYGKRVVGSQLKPAFAGQRNQ